MIKQISGSRSIKMAAAALFALVLSLIVLQSESRGEMLAPEGTQLVNITACSGLLGHYSPISGNVSTPLAVFNPNNIFISYLSMSEDTWNQQDPLTNPSRVVLTKYDGANCTTPIELTSNTRNPGNPSHNAPSVYVDGNGYVYVTYGLGASDADNLNAPWVRRSTNPLDPTAFEPAQRMRLWQGAELNGFTMKDGSVLFTGTDIHSRFDIALPYEPSGPSPNYLYTASKQPVASVHSAQYSRNGLCAANRFTKGVMKEGVGTDDNLYIIWGYSSSGPNSTQCWPYDQDYQHYTTDSHEMFFAYSEDKGLTWRNLPGTKSVQAGHCQGPTAQTVCKNNPNAGILFSDDDFRISTTRQIEYRQIWADPDGTIYVTYVKSNWCDQGLCDDPHNRVSTDPGSLMLLRFRLGDTRQQVEEFVINTSFHYWISAIRKDAATGKLYVWAHEQSAGGGNTHDLYEYVSEDDGETWSRTQISPSSGVGACHRMHGDTYTPFVKNTVYILFACRALNPEPAGNAYSHLYLYSRSFAHDTNLPGGWNSKDVGTGQAAGAASYWADGTFLVHGAGADVWGTSDEFRYVYKEVSGDFELIARVDEVEQTHNLAQAGIMIRETLDDDSRHAFLLVRAGSDSGRFKRRADTGGTTSNLALPSGVEAPYWLMLRRSGDTITALTSPDGMVWTEQGSDTIAMSATVHAGLAVVSYSSAVRNTSTFSHVSVQTNTWSSADIGNPGVAGSSAGAGSIYSIAGSGADIWANADELHYMYQTLAGDGEIVARVTSVSSPSGQSGVMMRESLDEGSKHAYVSIRAAGNTSFKRRTQDGGATLNTAVTGTAAPYWVKLVRLGDTFSAYHSPNGTNWSLINTAAIEMDAEILVGLAVTSQNNSILNTTVFDHVSVTAYLPWTGSDIGNVGIAGSASTSGQAHVLSGSGGDIWGTTDEFYYLHRSLTGDGVIEARIVDIDGTGQSGLMMRETLSANAKHVFLNLRAIGGTSFKSRTAAGGSTSNILQSGSSDPYWLRLVRTGNTFEGYHSQDGVTWVLVGSQTISMTEEIYVGLAVTSQNNSTLNTTEFDNVAVY